jgi:hypothetical protein
MEGCGLFLVALAREAVSPEHPLRAIMKMREEVLAGISRSWMSAPVMTTWTLEGSIGVADGDATGVQGSRQDLARTLQLLRTSTTALQWVSCPKEDSR